jgi:hypothetical protein
MHTMQARRDFHTALSAAARRVSLAPEACSQPGPPEVTAIRLSHDANIHQLHVLTREAGQ